MIKKETTGVGGKQKTEGKGKALKGGMTSW